MLDFYVNPEGMGQVPKGPRGRGGYRDKSYSGLPESGSWVGGMFGGLGEGGDADSKGGWTVEVRRGSRTEQSAAAVACSDSGCAGRGY
jgi:hypothetical protein